MKIFKENFRYYFSVEGQTEELYLKWLQKTINAQNSEIQVEFVCKICPPVKYVKNMNFKSDIVHICDYEGENNSKQFLNILNEMKKAQTLKNVNYKLGYSNIAFELWIILHKIDYTKELLVPKNYLEPINKAYKEDFQSLDDYKKENNFKKHILEKLTLNDVCSAIKRAKIITNTNKVNYKEQQNKGYRYYKENPSLSICDHIQKILKDCCLQ